MPVKPRRASGSDSEAGSPFRGDPESQSRKNGWQGRESEPPPNKGCPCDAMHTGLDRRPKGSRSSTRRERRREVAFLEVRGLRECTVERCARKTHALHRNGAINGNGRSGHRANLPPELRKENSGAPQKARRRGGFAWTAESTCPSGYEIAASGPPRLGSPWRRSGVHTETGISGNRGSRVLRAHSKRALTSLGSGEPPIARVRVRGARKAPAERLVPNPRNVGSRVGAVLSFVVC